MKAVQDFNYKVALATGLRHLAAGKLRQAEEQFRYLVAKFPRADGGHRGLAKVYVELGDRAAAVSTLRDGAAELVRGGERGLATEMLREAVALDPLDLGTHRRLAAALAVAGDAESAAGEYARYSRAELDLGDAERARVEAVYALETLGPLPRLLELARDLGIEPPQRAVVATPPRPAAEPERAAAATSPSASAVAGTGVDAARAYLSAGQVYAASDVLMRQVASGGDSHEAQQVLLEVAQLLGRRDIARAKAMLLSDAMRLAGHPERAGEVERLGQAL